MTIHIGPVSLENPVILAPMSGVTDQPFRRLVKRNGAALVISEMIASQAAIRETRQSLKMSTNCAEEFPMAVQLAGCDPSVMSEAAKLNADRGAAIIDINMGCPVKKVVNKEAGSALMRQEALAARFSPRRRQGVFWKRCLDLSACHRQGTRRGRKCGESMAIPVASSSPPENPRTEPSGV